MLLFYVTHDPTEPGEPCGATDIAAAVQQVVSGEDLDGFNDAFDMYARAVDADRWTIFPVRLRTETFVDVQAGRPGPVVDAWANENG